MNSLTYFVTIATALVATNPVRTTDDDDDVVFDDNAVSDDEDYHDAVEDYHDAVDTNKIAAGIAAKIVTRSIANGVAAFTAQLVADANRERKLESEATIERVATNLREVAQSAVQKLIISSIKSKGEKGWIFKANKRLKDGSLVIKYIRLTIQGNKLTKSNVHIADVHKTQISSIASSIARLCAKVDNFVRTKTYNVSDFEVTKQGEGYIITIRGSNCSAWF